MSEIRQVNLYRWAIVIVVACLVAGVVEIGVVISAVHTEQPNWDLVLGANRAGIVTSLICTIAGVVGARQKPTLGISELGVVVGFISLWFTLGLEGFSHVCLMCV